MLLLHTPCKDIQNILPDFKSCKGIEEKTRKKRRKRRHIPHRERPLEAVIKRNQRERRRVDDVNLAFKRLQTFLPRVQKNHRRVSKMAILQHAIEYIHELK